MTEDITQRGLAAVEEELSKPTVSIDEVVKGARDAEDTQMAWIMASQLNVMYDANLRLRGNPMFNTGDMGAFFTIMRYLMKGAQKSYAPAGRPQRN